MFLKYEEIVHNWVHTHMESIAILTGGLTGALWKTHLVQVAHDLWTLHNIESAIVVAIKALIGASVAWSFKKVCNFFTRKRIKTRKHEL